MMSLLEIPNEILFNIIHYINHIPHLHALSLTCRYLHELADSSLHRLAAQRHPYLLCWACGMGNVRLAERLLDAGVELNRPFRSFGDEGEWFNAATDTPMGVLDTVYDHILWTAAYSDADRRVSLRNRINRESGSSAHDNVNGDALNASGDIVGYDRDDLDALVSLSGQHYSDADKRLFSYQPVNVDPGPFNLYLEQPPNHEVAYDPSVNTDLYTYKKNACYWFPLHAAAMAGCDALVELLVRRGALIDVPSYGLCNCYHCCMEILPNELWDYVLHEHPTRQFEVDLEAIFSAPTPVHTALCHGKESTANFLLTLGTTITADLGHPESTVFHMAASRGMISTMQLLLDKQLADIDAHDHFGLTPLLHALGEPHSALTIRWLLEHGAEVNRQCGHGCTPLHVACYYGWYREANELIDAGAMIDIPYTKPVQNSIIISTPNGVLPIMLACMDDSMWQNVEFVYSSLYKKANIGSRIYDAHDGYGNEEHADQEAVRVIKRLLKAGRDIARCRAELQPAMIAAAAAHRPWLMVLLEEAGASVEKETDYMFPLLAAVKSDAPPYRESRQIETISWLLRRGVDINQVNSMGVSALSSLKGEVDGENTRRIRAFLREHGAGPPWGVGDVSE